MADSIKIMNVSVAVGDNQNFQDGPKIQVSIRSNYQECLELFSKTGLNFDNDLVYKIIFNIKSNLDDYTLGENIGFFKNKLNFLKTDQNGPLVRNHSMNLELIRDYQTYQNQVHLTVGLDSNNNSQIINDLEALAKNSNDFGLHVLDLNVEVNQRMPTTNYEQDEPRLCGRLTGKIEFNEMRMSQQLRRLIREQPYGPVPFWGFGLLMQNGEVDLQFHSLEQLIDSGLIPWPDGVPRFSGFGGLKNFLLPLAGNGMKELPRNLDTYGGGNFSPYNFTTELYSKLYETMTGVAEVKIGFRNYVISIKFSGLDFMNGYFPDLQTLLSQGPPVGQPY